MDISLESIDVLRARAGLTYAEARDALAATNGDVVEALVRAEQKEKEAGHESNWSSSLDGRASEIVGKVKELWAKGADTKIRFVRGDQTLFDIPLTAGLVGTLLAPQAALAGAIVAYASKTSIEIQKPLDQEAAGSGPSEASGTESAPGEEQGPPAWS